MYSAVHVAWKTLQIARDKGIQLSNLQLQKLVYISHGYFLGWKRLPLIREPVEAWTYGPVIAPIYHAFKQHGDSKIVLTPGVPIQSELDGDADACSVIDWVLSTYGRMDAISLVNLTHQPNTPWDHAWNRLGGGKFYSFPIDNGIIAEHFAKAIADPQSVGGL